MKIKSLSTLFIAAFMLSTVAGNAVEEKRDEKKVFISIDADALKFTQKKFGKRSEEIETRDGISVLKIDEDALPWLSMLMHRNFKRCGGFMLHDNAGDAENLLSSHSDQLFAQKNSFAAYKIDQDDVVKPMINQIQAGNILTTITQLSAFPKPLLQRGIWKKICSVD